MRKAIAIAATGYFIFFLLVVFPANSRSKRSFLEDYAKNPSEQVVEKVYDNFSEQLKITLWSLVGMYGACIVLALSKEKKSKETRHEPTNN